ncbi:MAG: flagellar hook-basal body complex protein [Rhodospirillaceae bacterium]|nr:flagellar hook-basal body complex protein [Rhodospirillaceae bacterium]
MSIKGTFNTAVQAMNAQSQHLSNISTNIANVNTTAYKTQRTQFKTLLNHVRPNEQKFFTVDTVDLRQVDRQGFLQSTQRDLDLAINGRGFFVTNTKTDGTGVWQYTRDGALIGRSVALTTDSDGDGQLDQGTLLTTGAGAYVYGWQADADGNFDEVDDLTKLVPIQINSNQIFPFKTTTAINLQANVSAESTGRQSVGMPFVDEAGQTRTLTLGFTATTTGVWDLDVSSNLNNGLPAPLTFNPPQVEFDGEGKLIAPAGGLLEVTLTTASGAQVINIDLSKVTQLSDNGDLTVQNIEQDGYLAGRLKDTFFDEDGVLFGSYTNQGLKALFKLPIATFAAPNNLEAKSGNFFTQSREAGVRKLQGLDSVTGLAQIVIGTLESSNVDLADQFSKMIVTQRAYSSSATVLRTADEMMQQTRDLKR